MFSLRFPFQLAATRAITNLNEFESWQSNGLSFKLIFKDPDHILTVSGFESEAVAKSYLNNIKSGFQWLLLKHGFAVNANWEFRHVEYSDDPNTTARNLFGDNANEPVDGSLDSDYPAVYPSVKNLVVSKSFPPQVSIGVPVNIFRQTFDEGIQKRDQNPIETGSKLETALDLYNFYYYTISLNAKLITLVMALETISEKIDKHRIAQDLIDDWKDQIEVKKRKLKSAGEDNYEAIESLEALEREILFRKDVSLRSQIRTFVKKILKQADNQDAESLSRIAVKVYDNRSSLLHDGNLPKEQLREAVSNARTIVVTVLKTIFFSEND